MRPLTEKKLFSRNSDPNVLISRTFDFDVSVLTEKGGIKSKIKNSIKVSLFGHRTRECAFLEIIPSVGCNYIVSVAKSDKNIPILVDIDRTTASEPDVMDLGMEEIEFLVEKFVQEVF